MMMKSYSALFAAMLAVTIGIAGCSRFGHHASGQLSEQQLEGKQLFTSSCGPCHETNEIPLPTKPPKLDGLFQKPTLPSGAPATDDQVRKTIMGGRGVMPPFGDALKSDEIDAIVAYLHTR